jgi:hypothetical protein
LYAIGGRRSQPGFAVAFPSDGARVVYLSGSGTERGYPERPRIPRLRIEPDGVIQLALGFRDSEPRRSGYGVTGAAMCELTISCFLRAWGLRVLDLGMCG